MLASDVATERLPLSLLLRWDDFWGDLESNKAGLVDPAFKEYLLPIIMVLRPEACMPTYMKGFKAKSINSKDLFYCRSKHEEDGNEVAYTAKFVSFAKTALQYDGIDTDWRVGDLEQDLERAVGVGKTFVNENVVGRPCREFGPGGGHELIPYLTHYKFFFIASECE